LGVFHLDHHETNPSEDTMLSELQAALAAIAPLDRTKTAVGQAHIDNLTKPKGSLGRLEDLALQLFLIQGGRPPQADPMRIYTVAGDHGVTEEGVSIFPQEVTRQMVLNFLGGGAGINVLAGTAGAQLYVVDAGSCGGAYDEHPFLIQAKIAPGTANLAKGPAMTEEQCVKALLLGISLADRAQADGVKVLGTGDMGISNTTPSTALYCAYLGLEPEAITGPGTGLGREGVANKAAVIRRGLAANAEVVQSGDPLAVLAALGGLEIATLAGLILGGARNHQLVCVDGFISTAAYAAAWKICPAVADYCVLSHASAEPGYAAAIKAMGLTPLLDLGFRLGEGTGAACAMYLVRSAADMYTKMATFADAGVAVSTE
jgi:nicotinate-nucleotide--dimethylbenzimidazole phosphoribosyltransferase